MKNIGEKEIQAFANISLVIAVILFSLLLSFFDLRSGWEGWTIPLFFVAIVIALVIHVTGFMTDEFRIYFLSSILILELFYYIAKINVVYESTPVVIFILILLTGAHKKTLIWICTAVTCFGVAFRVASSYGSINAYTGEKIALNLVLVFITVILLTKMLSSYEHTEMSFVDRIEELETENKSAGDFLANVSHEIRTPINTVIGLTGVCIEKETDEEIKEELHSVAGAGVRISEQISDILDYSEIDMDKLAVNKDEYSLSSLMNDLVSELKPYKRKDIELVIDVDPALPAIMRTDMGKLKKILWHIIVNGLKYTKEGGVYVHMTCTRQSYGLNLCVDVSDTGIGMTEEELERVYERFYQSDSGRTRTSGGLGLGMSIVRGFVRALGGFITIDSKAQSGTNVHISIPQEIVSDQPCMSVGNKGDMFIGTFLRYSKFKNPYVRDHYESVIRNMAGNLKINFLRVDSIEELNALYESRHFSHAIVGEEEYLLDQDYMEDLAKKLILIIVADDDLILPPGSEAVVVRKPFYCFPIINVLNTERDKLHLSTGRMSLSGINALVVDDEPMNLTVATNIFERYGMKTDTALSGQEAIDMCKEKKYDIVFMDHMMPQMDGIETVRRIRLEAGLNRQDTAFVALTANAVSTAREMFASEGFDGFVSKPIVLAELERVLRNVFPASAISYEGDDAAEAGSTENKTGERPQSRDPMDVLREAGITVESGLDYCMDDKELYREVLMEYAMDGESRISELDGYYAAADWENFKIRVHAVKSSSKTIGADRLSRSAAMLEQSSADENEGAIKALYPEFLSEYRRISGVIKELYGEDSK